MNKTLIDNSGNLKMVNTLNACISDPSINTIRIATGYWDIPGMALLSDKLREFLNREDAKLKIIIGKDPYVYANMLKKIKIAKPNYPADFIRTDINSIADNLVDSYKESFQLLLNNCKGDNPKIDIHIFRTDENDERQFFHSKCYIFTHRVPSHQDPSQLIDKGGEYNMYAIVGSSNFTRRGLEGNSELNVLETDQYVINHQHNEEEKDVKGHIEWFEEKWSQSVDWSKEFLEQVLKPSKPVKKIEKEGKKAKAAPFTPYELYIKLLQLQFGDIIDKSLSQQIEAYLPTKVNKLSFQIEAVKRCFGIMHEHGGFMLADVVGLGKTIIGALIIKRFLSMPEDDGRERKVLVITPPAIQSGWKKAIALFDKESDDKIAPCIDFITTGRIGSLEGDEEEDDDSRDSGEFEGVLQYKNYGLIIIDESHKFRNSNTLMYQSLDELIQNIGANTGVFPCIGLLSATPQNNRPNDLKNQIYLFERNHNSSTLKKAEGGDLDRFFSDVSREYEFLIDRRSGISDEERRQRLDNLSKRIRDCILTDILERRTRTDIEKYYNEDMKQQGIVFPKIVGPIDLKYIMDDELAGLFSDTMRIIAPSEVDKLQFDNWLRYYRYRIIEYFVDPANEQKHKGRGNRTVTDVAKQLATIMQILLVKRLESSFTAFRQSLKNLRRYTENMLNMWDNDTIFVCPQIDVNKELDFEAKSRKSGKTVTFTDCVEDIRAKIKRLNEQGRNDRGQNAEYKRKDFKPEYIKLLKKDYQIMKDLFDRWSVNSEDPKFDAFKESLEPELFNPQKNTSSKLVIFTEAIDTVKALSQAVKAKKHRPLVITAANRDEKEQEIEANFDANYEGEWKDDYDVIITTEVLAEGVNLHRANVILNYDTPWNATRLMQRIGRVNRIGSREPFVYVYNFMPSAQGDAEIQLVRKAYTKLQSFHNLFGEDSKIFTEDETVRHFDIKKAVEGEESPLEKYVHELKEYRDAHPERYEQITQANGNWEIAQTQSGTAYFLIKAPKSARLAIRVRQEDEQYKSEIISTLDLLEDMRVPENQQSMPLPSNWDEISREAINAYNRYFVRISKSRAGDKRTQALAVIVGLYNNKSISSKSKSLLKAARRLVDKGSIDVIRKVLLIDEELHNNQQNLFKLNQEDIDMAIEREIGKLVANVEKRQGEPMIELGTIKE